MPEDGLLSDGESLFVSPGILDIEYLPRLLPYREEQQKYLADCIKRLPSVGANVLIHGPSGLGKTACVRWVFRELKESEETAVPVYINCWSDTDLHKMALTICSQFGISTAYRSPDELVSVAVHRLKSLKAVVLAFDEIDRAHDQTFLYHFLEGIPHRCIFMISTKRDWLTNLDARVRSRLMPEAMEFRPYSREQTRGILEERKNYAFVHGVWDNAAFEIVVDKCLEAGDLRMGLALLKAGGLAAENEASRKITREHVMKAIGKLGIDAPEGKRKLSDF